MKVAVWDTYVKREDGKTMHFDILVDINDSDAQKVFEFGRQYLATKTYKTGELTANECTYCHIERASHGRRAAILKNGYTIIEMENCQ